MNKRDAVRYKSDLFPESMAKVTVSWDDFSPVVANVIDYGAHGLKVTIPSLQHPVEPPKKNNTVRVKLLMDEMWFSGMCISATREPDDSVTLSVYFYNPHEQNHLKKLLCNSLTEHHRSGSFISYEWEELVDKLCNADEPHLQKIGNHHKSILIAKQKGLTLHGD